MDKQTLWGILVMAAIIFLALWGAGVVTPDFPNFNLLSKSALRWGFGWMSLGACIAFIFVWGNNLASKKAIWGALVCGALAFIFL